jgi:hypothetical protein
MSKSKSPHLESLRIRIEAAQTLEEAQHVGLVLYHLIRGSAAGPCAGCQLDIRAELERLRQGRSRWSKAPPPRP